MKYAIIEYKEKDGTVWNLKSIIKDGKAYEPKKQGMFLSLGNDTKIIKQFKTKKEMMRY